MALAHHGRQHPESHALKHRLCLRRGQSGRHTTCVTHKAVITATGSFCCQLTKDTHLVTPPWSVNSCSAITMGEWRLPTSRMPGSWNSLGSSKKSADSSTEGG